MSFLGGLIDLCAFPAGTAPEGVKPNFTNPPTYAPSVVGVSVVVLFFATLFTVCRLIANWKKLAWADHFNTLALIFSIAQSGIVLSQVRYARHQWDIPACWFFGDFAKVSSPNVPSLWFLYMCTAAGRWLPERGEWREALLITPALMFSKASLLLLFLQIFQIQDRMRLAIRIGFAAIIIVYLPAFPLAGYYNTPNPGQSWDDVLMSMKPKNGIYWGIVQSALGIILDLYIFVLPLPAISKLQISKSKRNQLVLVFSTASMGVVANILSLAYRVLEFKNMDDATWNLYAIFLCAIVEINIAIIVCSVPGLAKFLRIYASDWSPLQSLRSKFFSPGNSANSSEPYLRHNHGWPAARQAEPGIHQDMEIATHKSTSTSLQRDDPTDVHVDDMREVWQVDPYLDTRGPEYTWMYTESPENGLAVGISAPGGAHGTQSKYNA